uniref:Uncharacterized protein n=1 Tax=Romanomermis culicivorax TaxID=13658 RepID=A0A915IZR7_ROMCU
MIDTFIIAVAKQTTENHENFSVICTIEPIIEKSTSYSNSEEWKNSAGNQSKTLQVRIKDDKILRVFTRMNDEKHSKYFNICKLFKE